MYQFSEVVTTVANCDVQQSEITVSENINNKIERCRKEVGRLEKEIERLEASKKSLEPLLGMQIRDIQEAMRY